MALAPMEEGVVLGDHGGVMPVADVEVLVVEAAGPCQSTYAEAELHRVHRPRNPRPVAETWELKSLVEEVILVAGEEWLAKVVHLTAAPCIYTDRNPRRPRRAERHAVVESEAALLLERRVICDSVDVAREVAVGRHGELQREGEAVAQIESEIESQAAYHLLSYCHLNLLLWHVISEPLCELHQTQCQYRNHLRIPSLLHSDHHL